MNDLAQAYRDHPRGAVGALMGGGPDEHPDRYAIADPLAHVPLEIPVLLVHGVDDSTVSIRRSRNYAQAARSRGASVELIEIPGAAGAHRNHLDPDGQSWAAVARWLEGRRERVRASPQRAA